MFWTKLSWKCPLCVRGSTEEQSHCNSPYPPKFFIDDLMSQGDLVLTSTQSEILVCCHQSLVFKVGDTTTQNNFSEDSDKTFSYSYLDWRKPVLTTLLHVLKSPFSTLLAVCCSHSILPFFFLISWSPKLHDIPDVVPKKGKVLATLVLIQPSMLLFHHCKVLFDA